MILTVRRGWTRSRVLGWGLGICTLFMVTLLTSQLTSRAVAQIVAPDFGLESDVLTTLADQADLQADDIQQLVISASHDFRQLLSLYTGMTVQAGSLTTLGLQTSLSPDTTALVAEMSGGSYGVTALLGVVDSSRPRLEVNLRVAATTATTTTDAQSSSSLLRETFPVMARPRPVSAQPPASDALSERPAYGEAVRDLAVQAAQFVRTQAQLDPALVVIRSDPPADVYIHDLWLGSGDTVNLELAPGSYDIDVRTPGFLSGRRTVVLEAEQTNFVQFALIPAAGGSVQVRSTPTADIYLAGFAYGASPVTIPAAAGEHEVFVFRPGFSPQTHTVSVNNFRVSRLDVTLTPITYNLLYWQAPAGFEVLIDGELRPGYLPNPELGFYTVEMRRSGRSIRFEVAFEREGIFELDLLSRSLTALEP
ncbi:MAG: PEGA domain-containing protein [Deinococcota bacterium]